MKMNGLKIRIKLKEEPIGKYMDKKLAIVIPAYKAVFFDDVLLSLSNQTCKQFNVYIGIDASNEDFETIISKYSAVLSITWKRFNTNLGGTDLVAQWERCIELTNGEPWIWLFSDDDIIGKRCVELLLNEISNDYDLYHFNVKRIDEKNNVVCEKTHFPIVWTGKDMFWAKQCDKIDSFVVEYIFSRKVYERTGGFQNFPMAWGSDIATWIKFAGDNGIKTVAGDFVYWRKSSENITPQKNRDMSIKKILIETDYLDWVNKFFHKTMTNKCSYLYFRSLGFYSPFLSWSDASDSLKYAKDKALINNSVRWFLFCLFPVLSLAKKIVNAFKDPNKH